MVLLAGGKKKKKKSFFFFFFNIIDYISQSSSQMQEDNINANKLAKIYNSEAHGVNQILKDYILTHNKIRKEEMDTHCIRSWRCSHNHMFQSHLGGAHKFYFQEI